MGARGALLSLEDVVLDDVPHAFRIVTGKFAKREFTAPSSAEYEFSRLFRRYGCVEMMNQFNYMTMAPMPGKATEEDRWHAM